MNQLLEILRKINKKTAVATGTALLAVLLLIGFYGCRRENKIYQAAAAEVWQNAETIRAFYRSKPNYWGLNGATAIKNNLTVSWKKQKGKLYNLLNKEVFIGNSAGETVMPGGKDFNIIYSDLSREECREIAAYHPSEQQSLGLRGMIIESALTTEFDWRGKNKLPVSQDAADQACGKTSRIIWNFE